MPSGGLLLMLPGSKCLGADGRVPLVDSCFALETAFFYSGQFQFNDATITDKKN